MAIYVGGIAVAVFTLAGVYFKNDAKLNTVIEKLNQVSSENAILRQDVKNLNLRFDQVQSLTETRYYELKLELEKKQDKRK